MLPTAWNKVTVCFMGVMGGKVFMVQKGSDELGEKKKNLKYRLWPFFVSQLAISPANILARMIIYFLCPCIFP